MEITDRKILFVDKTLNDCTSAIMRMAATSSDEVRFDLSRGTTHHEGLSSGEQGSTYFFEDRIPKTVDLFRGIKFMVPVMNFKLWLQDSEGKFKKMIIDLTDQSTGIKRLTITDGIPVCRIPYMTIHMSYTFTSGKEIHAAFDKTTIYDKEYGFLDPLLYVSILNDTLRNEVIMNESREFTVNALIEDGSGSQKVLDPVIIPTLL